MALISIIVPVYNVEKYLEKCIRSIQDQTLKDIEVILVDDGAPDRCGAMCDEFAQNDSRIRVIHKQNGGVSSARNAGLAIATGEYIGFVDSDDYIESDMYETLYHVLQEYDADIAVCGHFVEKDGKIIEEVRNNGFTTVVSGIEACKRTILDHEINSFAWDKLYNRELFSNFAYPALFYHEDIASTFLIMSKARRVVLHNIAKYHYIRNSNSISLTMNPLKVYHSFLAYKRQEEFTIKNNMPDLLEYVHFRMFTTASNAIILMIRTQEYKLQCKEPFYDIRRVIKEYLKTIITNPLVEKRVKLYSWLTVFFPIIHVGLCRLNMVQFFRKVRGYKCP